MCHTQVKLTTDSPGCPSPTDSDVNMKEPSSNRLLILFYRAKYSARLSTLGEKRFLDSHQPAVQGDLKAALYSCWFLFKREMKKGRLTALQSI